MTTYSASRIKLYQDCRAQYYDKYVLRLPETRKDTSGLFGSALHSAIEHRYLYGSNPIQRFARYVSVMYNWYTRKGYTISHSMEYSDMLSQGREILLSFPWKSYDPIELEYEFTVPFYDFTIHGYIDLITADGTLVDFKSSKRKPSGDSHDNDTQFLLYYHAYEYRYGYKPAQVLRHNLRDHSVQVFLPRDMETKYAYIETVIKTIEQDTFDDLKDGLPICQRCAPWCGRKLQ